MSPVNCFVIFYFVHLGLSCFVRLSSIVVAVFVLNGIEDVRFSLVILFGNETSPENA